VLKGHFKQAAYSGKLTDSFGGTEFIAPDVLFKTTNASALKKHSGHPDRWPSRGLAAGRAFYCDRKIINETKW